MSVKTFAAIDVGSFELTMKIFDFSGKNTMREIDCIRQRIDLGSDTYANGKISNEKMDDLCHTLKEFAQIMEAYKVIAYKAYGTSAIRETENTLILQDQIEQRTGIRVEILSNSEQRFLDYKSIASKGETFRRIIEEKTAILDIGGGSIQISLFDKDTLVSTQNLRLGVLRLQELLNHLNAGSTQMEQLVDELATAQLDDYKKLYLKDREFIGLRKAKLTLQQHAIETIIIHTQTSFRNRLQEYRTFAIRRSEKVSSDAETSSRRMSRGSSFPGSI